MRVEVRHLCSAEDRPSSPLADVGPLFTAPRVQAETSAVGEP